MIRIQMFCSQSSVGLINLKSDPNMMNQSFSKHSMCSRVKRLSMPFPQGIYHIK